MQSPIDFYALLGVARSATLDEIKMAYRAGIAHYHPDRNRSPHAGAVTALLNEAWEGLGHPERRRQYDRALVLDARHDRRGSSKAVAPNAVWLVRNHDHRNVWSVWSSAQKAVLACKRYRASGFGTAAFEIVPIEVDLDNFARSPWERAVDDLD
jgi:curved DNA-binding protein CbpA